MAIITGDMVVPGGKGPNEHQDDIKFGESYRFEYDALGRPRIGSGSANNSYSRSRSRSYDYTGMDKAHEISQQAAAGDGAMIDAAMNDPMAIPGLQNRIGAMQRYVNAYKSGQDLPDQVVLPARRLASESDSISRSAGRAQSVVRDKMGKSVKEISPLKDPPTPVSQQPAKGAMDNLPRGDMGGGEGEMQGDPPPMMEDAGPPPDDDRNGIQQMPLPPNKERDRGMSEGDPGKQQMRGSMKTYSNAEMVEDPTIVLKRIQEEMGLV